MHDEKKKVALIAGAGPAGLTAAYLLLKESDIHPVVLEESDQVGGISRTEVHHGNRMDLGGHRFFSKNREVMALWEELMPVQGAPALDDRLQGTSKAYAPGGPDPEREDRVMLLRNRISRIYYLKKFYDYPISLKLQTFLNMGLKRTLCAGLGYAWAVVRKRPERSLEDFYINRFGKPLYRMFFEDYTEKLWGVHPSHIAPDWGAQRIKGLSLFKAIGEMLAKPFRSKSASVETSLISEFLYPKKGPGQLWELMADKIRERGGEIRLNTRVTGVELSRNRVSGVHVLANGRTETLVGDFLISSIPIKDLVASMSPAAPSDVGAAANALPYRDFLTVGLLLKKLRLRNASSGPASARLVPDCWIYIQEREVKIGRLQIFNNWSPYLVQDFQNTVWLGLEYFCQEGDAFWNQSEEECIRFAVGELEQIGIIDKEDVLDAVRIRVKKAYPAYFGGYDRFPLVRSWLDGIENLYCVGRNGQHRYNNMDHSMLSAMTAVRALTRGDASKAMIWDVNADKDYHEVK
jgi:protoporphyrinogen oxidase